ncbi:5-(carboxyamino)imidazole ribonucleotide synthase [Gammaproteobacteria bacterium]|nr:5-(carboxyamino)imidazole ribonucleotide synthase [Gammaproteobacteria bacterium]
MLSLAGWPLGLKFSFLAEPGDTGDCVRGLGALVPMPDGFEAMASTELAAQVYASLEKPDVITVEKESVPVDLLEALKKHCAVYPDPKAVRICQNRGCEKEFIEGVGAAMAPKIVVNTAAELKLAIEQLGFPVIVKTCEDGYDGLNQWKMDTAGDLTEFLESRDSIVESVVEKRVNFSREISLILVRAADGRTASYPATQNWHEGGILRASLAPAQDIDEGLAKQIEDLTERVLDNIDYVGVLAIECFVVDGKLLVNELAPRVHNSGHWTQQGAATSQFENHLRAIAGLPLGSTEVHGFAGMVNLLGVEINAQTALKPNAFFHTYNKSVRPNRKVGHINIVHNDAEAMKKQLDETIAAIYSE